MPVGESPPSFTAFERQLRLAIEGLFSVTPDVLEKLYLHYGLLLRWNRVVGLTTITELAEAVRRHYCESLLLASRLPAGALRILDVGSGAGFPGVPIAALRPECRVVLAERRRRKAAFLKEATRDWENVEVFAGPAEVVGGCFDWVVSRAVNAGAVLSVARLKGKGVALLLGKASAENLRIGAGLEWEQPVTVPWADRRVLLFGRFATENKPSSASGGRVSDAAGSTWNW